jgi:site-specific DNA recombinase
MRHAAVYVRISQDRAGAGLGVARQEADCRELAQRRGWDVVEVFTDNDVSAYTGKARPAWSRLVRSIEAGTVDAVICWHVDRLTRSPRELEDVIDLADRHGVELATVTGEVDLATPTGRLVARMLGAAARHESEHKAQRQRRERRAAAEAGKVAGGGMRPYGYREDRVTIDPAEARVIREMTKRALAGESLSSICRDLERRDVRTPYGNHWSPSTLRRLLASARISGRREHLPRASWQRTRPLLGEIVADAVWPGIITPEQSDRLRALLSAPGRRSHAGTGTTYLLSGLLRCGLCSKGLVGRPRHDGPGGARYICAKTPGAGGCSGISTAVDWTDDLIRDLVLAALDTPALAEHLRHDDEPSDAADLAAAEQQLEDLASDWAAGAITRGEWKAARRVLDAKVADLRARMLKGRRELLLAGVALGPGLRDAWDGLTTAQRRELVATVVERIVVKPARGKRDADRFEITWRA